MTYFRTVKVGAAAGLYQIFLESGAESGMLLTRTYTRAEASRSSDRELLPYMASLLSRWESAPAASPPEPSRSRVGNTLTERERDILVMISQGFSNKRIARTPGPTGDGEVARQAYLFEAGRQLPHRGRVSPDRSGCCDVRRFVRHPPSTHRLLPRPGIVRGAMLSDLPG